MMIKYHHDLDKEIITINMHLRIEIIAAPFFLQVTAQSHHMRLNALERNWMKNCTDQLSVINFN